VESNLWTPTELLAQNQMIGLPEVDRSYELCEALEDITYRSNYHEYIDKLELAIEQSGSLDWESVHYVHDGIYIRELTIPAGLLITGMIHRHNHMVVVSKGSIIVWEQNKGSRIVTAPATFHCEAGVRRVGYTMEETVWSTIHATELTTIPELEESLFELRAHQTYPHMRQF
jgi:hypothetical protein